MTSIRVYRHGERWAVAQAGAESPVKEYPTREAAEVAARQLAGGADIEVVDEGDRDVGAATDAVREEERPQGDAHADGALEPDRSIQPGL